jgi:beta-lactamase class A
VGRRRYAVQWTIVVAVVVAAASSIFMTHRSAATPVSFQAAPASLVDPLGFPSAVPSLSPAPSVPPRPSVHPSPAKPKASPTAQTLAAYLSSVGGRVGVEVLDRTTGRTLAANTTERFKTASIVKVDILATLLWQDQTAGTTMTTTQKQTAVKMITQSDNTAADTLWATIGKAPGLAKGDAAFGLTHTTPGTTSAHPWGDTLTTAADQLQMLTVLMDSSGPLTSASRSYILGLMSRVESDQRWGVPTAAVHPSAVYVKDGWYPQPSDSGRWSVNSIGRIVEPGHDFLVVTLSDHRTTESAGITIIEHAAKLSLTTLRTPA